MTVSGEMTHLEATETHATTEHVGPHIPSAKGEIIEGWAIFGLPITNVVFSTWIFMAFLFLIIATFFAAIRTERFPRIRSFGLDIVNRIYVYIVSLIGNTQISRKYVWLL